MQQLKCWSCKKDGYYSKLLKGGVVLAWALMSQSAMADDLRTWNEWHQEMGGYIEQMGERVDRFLGDETLEVTSKGNELRIYQPNRLYDNGDLESNLNVRIKFDLPKTEQRWRVVFSSFEEDLTEEGELEAINQTSEIVTENERSTLTAQYFLNRDERSTARLDFGMRFYDVTKLNPFARLRYRTGQMMGSKLYSRQTYNLVAERQDGFFAEAQQRFDFELQGKQLLRSQSGVRVYAEQTELNLRQTFALYQPVNSRNLMTYYADGQWVDTIHQALRTDYIALGANWRHQFALKWLFIELEPRMRWFDLRLTESEFSAMVKFEAQFYHQ